MTYNFLEELLKGTPLQPAENVVSKTLTPEQNQKIRDYLGEARGMGESTEARSSGAAPAPIISEEAPMGMAESLRQRSGDDMMKPAMLSPASANPSVSGLLRKEATVNSANLGRRTDLEDAPDTELPEAMAERDRLSMLMMLGKGAERVGTAISGTESDKGYWDGLKPIAESKVADVLTKRRSASDKVDTDIKKFNYAFAKDKDDPLSPSSVFYRDTMKELTKGAGLALNIPDNMSAAEMEKLYPTIANIVSQREAQQARLAAAELANKDKKDKAVEKDSDEKRKFTRDLRKELGTAVIGKLQSNLAHAEKAYSSIQQFQKNPTGYSDYSTLMGGLKALQGDESVVREAEMKMGTNAASIKSKIQNQIDQLKSGKSLQPEQRQQILDTVTILHDISLRQYNEAIAPVMFQAEQEGIDPASLLPSNVLKANQPKADSASGEVERLTKDGQTAIFDAKTKKFLRYK